MKKRYLKLDDECDNENLPYTVARIALELSRLPDGTIDKESMSKNSALAFEILFRIESELLKLSSASSQPKYKR